MKHINILIYANRFVFITTIVLYATIFLGLLAQMGLGGLQVLSAIFLSFIYKEMTKETQGKLIFYWCFVIAYGGVWFSGLRDMSNDFFEFVFYVLIPLSIAGYFTLILESLKKEI